MPIAPENRDRYPRDWPAISRRIRFVRAGGRCECRGECGLFVDGRPDPRMWWHGSTGDSRCTRVHGAQIEVDSEEFGRVSIERFVILTVAHLNHQPEDCRDDNLRAMCQACHLRYDRGHHATSRRARRTRGQLALMFGDTA